MVVEKLPKTQGRVERENLTDVQLQKSQQWNYNMQSQLSKWSPALKSIFISWYFHFQCNKWQIHGAVFKLYTRMEPEILLDANGNLNVFDKSGPDRSEEKKYSIIQNNFKAQLFQESPAAFFFLWKQHQRENFHFHEAQRAVWFCIMDTQETRVAILLVMVINALTASNCWKI